MTNKYDDIFNYAALARSSYADLSKIRKKDDSERILSAIKDYDKSEEFARQIADKYYVLAHWKDRDTNKASIGCALAHHPQNPHCATRRSVHTAHTGKYHG